MIQKKGTVQKGCRIMNRAENEGMTHIQRKSRVL